MSEFTTTIPSLSTSISISIQPKDVTPFPREIDGLHTNTAHMRGQEKGRKKKNKSKKPLSGGNSVGAGYRCVPFLEPPTYYYCYYYYYPGALGSSERAAGGSCRGGESGTRGRHCTNTSPSRLPVDFPTFQLCRCSQPIGWQLPTIALSALVPPYLLPIPSLVASPFHPLSLFPADLYYHHHHHHYCPLPVVCSPLRLLIIISISRTCRFACSQNKKLTKT